MRRGEVWLVSFDPTIGSEIRKTRPAVIISPDGVNLGLKTIIVAPFTSSHRDWPTRMTVPFQDRESDVALEQLRAISKKRLKRKIGKLPPAALKQVLARVQSMFEY